MAGFWKKAEATGRSFAERLGSYFKQQPKGVGKTWKVYPVAQKWKAWDELAAQGASRQGTLSRDMTFRDTIKCAFGSTATHSVPKDASGHSTRAHRDGAEGEMGDEWIIKFDNGRVVSVGWSYDDPDAKVKAGRWTVTGTDKADVALVKAAMKECQLAGVSKTVKKALAGKASAALPVFGYRGSFNVAVTIVAKYVDPDAEALEDAYGGRRGLMNTINQGELEGSIRRTVSDVINSTDFAREVVYEQIGEAEFPKDDRRSPIEAGKVSIGHKGKGLSYRVDVKVAANIDAPRSLSAATVGKAIKQALESQLDVLGENAIDEMSLRGDLEFTTVRVTVTPAGKGAAKRKAPAKRKPAAKKAAKRKPVAKKRAKKPAARKKGTVKARAKRPGR